MKNESKELIVKEVDFQGASILSVQDVDGKIWVGVSYVSDGIGLNVNQRDRQVKNIQEDIVLKNGSKKLNVKFDGQVREVLVIELDYLPLWLAKISITPAMQENNPDVVDKLIDYQLKAKDVLAKEFIHKDMRFQVPQNLSEALYLAAELSAENEVLKPKANKYDKFLNSDGLIQLNEVAKYLKIGLKTFYSILRTEGILMKQKRPDVHIPMRKFEQKNYFIVIREQAADKKGNMVWQSTSFATHSGFDFLENFFVNFFKNENKTA